MPSRGHLVDGRRLGIILPLGFSYVRCLTELAGMSARKIAAELNQRKVVTPTGGGWHAATVIRVQKQLGLI